MRFIAAPWYWRLIQRLIRNHSPSAHVSGHLEWCWCGKPWWKV